MRPDAVLWGPSVALALPSGRRRARAVVIASGAFAVGVLPLLAYNTVTQGHPLAFTQGSEFRGVFTSGLAVLQPALAAAASHISGGAFRLVHFPSTFAAHLRYLVGAFGVFFWVALATLVVGLLRRRPLTRVLAPYVVVGLLFYSCWSHGDARYLVGVSLALIVLAASGMVALAAAAAAPETGRTRRLLLVGTVVALLATSWLFPRAPGRGLGTLERAAGIALLAAAAGATVRVLRPLAPLAPAMALATVGALRIVGSTGTSEGFRGADVEHARRTIEATVPPASLVLVSHGLGRPAENWTHYTHADAHYFGELARLISHATIAVERATAAGRQAFVLLAAGETAPFPVRPEAVVLHEVARREGAALRDWFVDPKRAPQGAVLYAATLTRPRP
jgi:hypothetical protein